MAATTILTTDNVKDAFGDEFIVTAGTPVGICLTGADILARAIAVKKDPAGLFQPTSIAFIAAAPDGTIVAPGTYKMQRKAGTCGAFRD